MDFWGPIIKEGLILVISIVTVQNCFGDLGDVCGMGESTGTFWFLIICTPYITMISIIARMGLLHKRV